MRSERLGILLLVVFFMGGLGGSASHEAGQARDEAGLLENFLRTAEIREVQENKELGTTDPWIVILNDGKSERRAIFKHSHRCRPHPLPDCYKYELAAYELSRMLGLEIVPPAVKRTVQGIEGSLQIMVEGCTSLQDYAELEDVDQNDFHRRMLDILVFDNLTYWKTGRDDINEDILYHPQDGRICRVDFSKAFEAVPELLGVEREVKQCSQLLYDALGRIDEGELAEKLAAYLNREEIDSLLVRKQKLVDTLSPLR